jgi:hypothetical protein
MSAAPTSSGNRPSVLLVGRLAGAPSKSCGGTSHAWGSNQGWVVAPYRHYTDVGLHQSSVT